MKLSISPKKLDASLVSSVAIPILLFGIVLAFRIPQAFTRFFGSYSLGMFALVLVANYLIYRLPGRAGILAGFGFTLLLCALTLSHRWASGFSDNFLIGGLLPYKDAKNYYEGANLLLNGLPLESAGQATERPLFPGFLSSLFLLTGQNLKVSLAILALLAGTGLYVSSCKVSKSFGPISASLYSTLLFFYIQPWLGYTMSEIFGFCMGCFAFALIWRVTRNPGWFELILGVFTLLIAVSARAGAFLIFPLLALWVGWIFRGEGRFSLKAGVYAVLIIGAGYFLLNSIYGRLLGVPAGSTFGNFAYALYGQVRGGTGWHSAIEELGARNPAVVYRAAWQFFLAHPFSLLIAFAKAYRDFFLPGHPNILPFDVFGQPAWATYTLWLAFMSVLIWGVIYLAKNVRQNSASLLLAGFLGILLSIPFLPPIDGGSRFYASTMPFLYIIPAVGVSRIIRNKLSDSPPVESKGLQIGVNTLIALTVILPVFTYWFSTKPETEALACPPGQEAFTIKNQPSSYIDLIQDGTADCGFSPAICLGDFEANNTEMGTDDFYQVMFSVAQESNLHVIPAINVQNEKFGYFFTSPDDIDSELLSGCATQILTKNQTIYSIESVNN